jgi:hypothetical protein
VLLVPTALQITAGQQHHHTLSRSALRYHVCCAEKLRMWVLWAKHTAGLVRETARAKEVYFEEVLIRRGPARDEGGNLDAGSNLAGELLTGYLSARLRRAQQPLKALRGPCGPITEI